MAPGGLPYSTRPTSRSRSEGYRGALARGGFGFRVAAPRSARTRAGMFHAFASGGDRSPRATPAPAVSAGSISTAARSQRANLPIETLIRNLTQLSRSRSSRTLHRTGAIHTWGQGRESAKGGVRPGRDRQCRPGRCSSVTPAGAGCSWAKSSLGGESATRCRHRPAVDSRHGSRRSWASLSDRQTCLSDYHSVDD